MKTFPFPNALLINRSVGLLLAGLLSLALASCNDDSDDGPDTTTHFGAPVAVGNGQARSFVTLDQSGNPLEIGLRLSETGLNGLPTTDPAPPAPPHWYTLSLPTEAAKTPFDHVSLDWAPSGHEPQNVYTLPHFDVHFYMSTVAERQQIAPNDPRGENLPPAGYLPADYIATPGTVPQMGKHWVDPTGHEYHGQAFTQTFIYGSFDRKVTFMEPMIARSVLLAKTAQTFDIKQPQNYQIVGRYYPTKYTIRFDNELKEHLVVLHDMVLR